MPRNILKTAVQTAVTLVPEIVSGVGSVTNASNAIKVQTGQQAVDSQTKLSALRGLEKFLVENPSEMIFKKNPMGPIKIGDEYFDVDHKGINGVLEHLVINNHYPNKETAMKELARLCIEIPKEMELVDLIEKALSRPNSYLSRWGTANLEQVAQHIEQLDSNALARLCEKDGFKKTEKLGKYLESIKNHKRIPHIDDPKLVTELLSFYAYKVSKYREIDPALHDKIKKFELTAHRELDDKGEKSHQKKPWGLQLHSREYESGSIQNGLSGTSSKMYIALRHIYEEAKIEHPVDEKALEAMIFIFMKVGELPDALINQMLEARRQAYFEDIDGYGEVDDKVKKQKWPQSHSVREIDAGIKQTAFKMNGGVSEDEEYYLPGGAWKSDNQKISEKYKRYSTGESANSLSMISWIQKDLDELDESNKFLPLNN